MNATEAAGMASVEVRRMTPCVERAGSGGEGLS